jgi:hypothetical protein
VSEKTMLVIGADIVISAADGHSTIFDLLGGRYLDNKVRSYYREMTMAKSILQMRGGRKTI